MVDNKNVRMIKGTVFSGVGEGKFYMSQKGYIKQFKKLFGFIPYLGTLNLKVDADEYAAFLKGKNMFLVSGFVVGERKFGGLRCYECEVNGIKCGLVIPDITHYKKDTIELISNDNLRDKLNIKDGDSIEIS